MIKDSTLRLLLISTELIERGMEVTVPFDFDYQSSPFRVECACVPMSSGVDTQLGSPSSPDDRHRSISLSEPDPCPIAEFNRELSAKALLQKQQLMLKQEREKQAMEQKYTINVL